MILDNLREGVIDPEYYDPTLNPLFRDVLAHYGVVALPCRVRDPDRKGKVESGVGHAQKTPLKGQRFESLEEAQAYLDRWEARWADTRIHGTTKRQVGAMFAEEKPSLKRLPIEPFRYYKYGAACRPSRRLCGSRSGLLRFTARLDRTNGQSAVGHSPRPDPRPEHLSTPAGACPSKTRWISCPPRRQSQKRRP